MKDKYLLNIFTNSNLKENFILGLIGLGSSDKNLDKSEIRFITEISNI